MNSEYLKNSVNCHYGNNVSYYEQHRDSYTPPQTVSSSSFMSPDQGYSSFNSTYYYTSPNNGYLTNQNNQFNSTGQNWQDYYDYYDYYNQYNYSQSYYSYSNHYLYNDLNERQDKTSELPNFVEKTESPKSNSQTKAFIKLAQSEINDDDDDNTKKTRIRTQFTVQQRKYLLNMFSKNIYPTKEDLEQASEYLRMSKSIIQTWFKNTRSKQKKLCHTKNL